VVDGVAHFGDDVVGAERNFGGEGNFFENLAVTGDGGDAEVGAAEVDSDGEIGHGLGITELAGGMHVGN